MRPLGVADAVSFYQLLVASSKVDWDSLETPPAKFVDLLRDTAGCIGNPVRLDARVRRCVKVAIEDPRISSRLNADHYFELDLFIALNRKKIVINNPNGSPLEYEDLFPITLCTLALPNQMSPQDFEKKRVKVNGVFFRLWKFDAEKTKDQALQISPLVFSNGLEIVRVSQGPLDSLLTAGIVIAVVIISAIGFYFHWSDSRSSRRKGKSRSENSSGGPEKVSIEIDLGESDSPSDNASS